MEETIANNVWQKGKLLVKGLIIGVLVLLLLIPAYFVQNLIREREERQKEAVAEVSGKWAGRQNITGPILVIPYDEHTVSSEGKPIIVRHHAYFLPDKLDIVSKAEPEKRYRGIYEVMLYTSETTISGKFSGIPLDKLKLQPANMRWSEAFISMAISDPGGLRNEVRINWNDSSLLMNPASVNNDVLRDAFTVPIDINENNVTTEFRFSSELRLNGSEQLVFTPTGKETTVSVNSSWPDPSFTGGQLPDSSQISKSGFKANWKSLSHTHGFPQQWKDNAYTLGTYSDQPHIDPGGSVSAEAFGVNLFVPVNGYQKTMRSVKYAILCILLTFTAFFLIETTNRKSVHPVQYALIGFALILFYTLLLSFSEYTGFNVAYAIAAIATVGLISWFVKGLLGSVRLSLLLSVVLVLMYSYVFTILQLQDYALLLGSIGLFLTLAVVMYFSKKIQW